MSENSFFAAAVWIKKISEITKGENNPFYGKPHDEFTKQKLREHKKCKKILFISVNNGEKMIFESMHVASNKMNIPRSRIKHRCENGYRQGDEYYIYYLEEYNNKKKAWVKKNEYFLAKKSCF